MKNKEIRPHTEEELKQLQIQIFEQFHIMLEIEQIEQLHKDKDVEGHYDTESPHCS